MKFKSKTILLVAWLLSFVLVLGNLVSVFAEGGGEKEKVEEKSVTFTVDNSDLSLDSSVITGNSELVIGALINNENPHTGVSVNLDFLSKVGDIAIIAKTPEGKFRNLNCTITQEEHLSDENGNTVTSNERNYSWGTALDSLDSAIASALHFEDDYICSINDYFPADVEEIVDYLKNSEIYVLNTAKEVKLNCSFYDFILMNASQKNINPLEFKITALASDKFKLELLEEGTLCTNVSDEHLISYSFSQDGVSLFTTDSSSIYNELTIDSVPYDSDIVLEVVTFNTDKFTFNLSELWGSNSNSSDTPESIIVEPKVTITGIPTSVVNEAFSVKIETDIPCRIIESGSQNIIGTTSELDSVSYKIDKGNGTYTIICQPIAENSDLYVYQEVSKSFDINCFSDDYVVPSDDDTSEDDDVILDNSDSDILPPADNTPDLNDGGKLEQTGIFNGNTLWFFISLFLVLSAVLLLAYKKESLKRLFSIFLVLILVITGINLPQVVFNVNAGGTPDNVTHGGTVEGGDSGGGVASVGEFCFADYVVTYMIYPVNLRDDYTLVYTSDGWANPQVRSTLNSASRDPKGFVLTHDVMAPKSYQLLRNNSTDKTNPLVQSGQRSALGHSKFEARLQYIANEYGLTFPDITEDSFVYSHDGIVYTSAEVQGALQVLENFYSQDMDKKAFILNKLFDTNEFDSTNCRDISIAVELGLGIHQKGSDTYYIQNTLGMDSYIGKTSHRWSNHRSHPDAMCTQLKNFFRGGILCSKKTKYSMSTNCIRSLWCYDWSACMGLRQASDYFYNSKFYGDPTNVGSISVNEPERTRKSGIIFVFSSDAEPQPIVRYEYNYALIAVNEPNATDSFTTTNKAIKYDSNLLRRTRKYVDDVLDSTTYAISTNGKSFSNEYTNLDTLFAEKVNTKYTTVSTGYTIAKANIGYFKPYYMSAEAIINCEDSVPVNYRYNGRTLTGGTFRAGKTFTFYQDNSYTFAISTKSTTNVYDNLATFSGNIATIQKRAIQLLNTGASGNVSANIIWSNGTNYSTLATSDIGSTSFYLPVISFSQYKEPTVKSTVYEVELTYDGTNYNPFAPKKLKDLSYSVGNSGSYTIGAANTKYVVISNGSANPGNVGASSLSALAAKYGTPTAQGAAKKGDTIKVGTTDVGSGYNIYIFTLKGIDNLNMTKNYTLEPYMLNRVFTGLDSNGKVYTLADSDFKYYNGSSYVNKADLYQVSLTGNTFKNGLTSAGIKNVGTGTDNSLGTAITYSTSSNHKIVSGYNTGTSYKRISILDSYALALSRGVIGDNKILSSIAVGTDKTSVNNIDANNRTKFNLGYGLKGNTPNSAYATATHRNYVSSPEVNNVKIEGRYPYNYYSGGSYQALTPTHASYNSVKYNKTIQGGIENKANYLLGWSGSTENRYRTLNFTANVTIKSYNSGALAEGKANVNRELLSTANKTIYAKDNDTHLKFYPELYMMYYTSPTTANYKVPVMGEYERKVQGSSLYGFKVTASGNPTGKTVSDMTSTSGATYRGSDVTTVIDGVGAQFEAFGYSLDIINKGTDSFNNSVVGDNNVYTSWGNSGTADVLKNEFNTWVTNELSAINFDIKLDLANGKSYSNFDISTNGVSMNSSATTNSLTWSITVKNGKLVEDANYTNLIKQIASDFGITEAEAKTYFANSNIAKSIINSMETCVNSANKSDAQTSITPGSHWYDEFTRTFVIRRFSNNTIKAGSITIQDKIDMDANTSTTIGSGINQTIKGNDVKADWKLTIKRDEGTILNNVKVNGATFDVSYLTTED